MELSSKDGRSLKKAFDFILPFYLKEKEWSYEQIADLEDERIYALLLKANKHFSASNYSEFIKKFNDKFKSDVTNILANDLVTD